MICHSFLLDDTSCFLSICRIKTGNCQKGMTFLCLLMLNILKSLQACSFMSWGNGFSVETIPTYLWVTLEWEEMLRLLFVEILQLFLAKTTATEWDIHYCTMFKIGGLFSGTTSQRTPHTFGSSTVKVNFPFPSVVLTLVTDSANLPTKTQPWKGSG